MAIVALHPPVLGDVVGSVVGSVVGWVVGSVVGVVVPSGATAWPVDGEIMPVHSPRLVRLVTICGMALRVVA